MGHKDPGNQKVIVEGDQCYDKRKEKKDRKEQSRVDSLKILNERGGQSGWASL